MIDRVALLQGAISESMLESCERDNVVKRASVRARREERN